MKKISSQELMGLLMAFSDTYMNEIMECCDEVLARPANSSFVRLYFERVKVYYPMGAITNACQANPKAGLLDMMTMVSLQTIVWGDPRIQKMVGQSNARDILDSLRELEEEIWNIGRKVFLPRQLSDVRELIRIWRKNHPDEEYVAFIRFQDFAPSRMKDTLDKAVSGSGLLAPINEATRELHESRILAERGMFLLKRLPMFMQWYGTLMGSEIFAQPEVAHLIADLGVGVKGIQDIGDALKKMPDLNKFQDSFFKKSKKLLAEERQLLFVDFSKQQEALKQISFQSAAAARDLRLMFESLERMTESPEPRDPDELSGLDKVAGSIESLSGVTRDLNVLLGRFDRILEQAEKIKKVKAVEEIDDLLCRHEQQLAMYIAGLLILSFVLGVAFVLILRRVNKC
ncbi:hypothetical protein [Maridesulfovibrio sp.]|uniref:hypothetical protein n=1 Tax=Maridesulfovibrio sp. TaxID=2795000 RepID=UPI002A188472|nr:hypothetical protein [Maridesulfovibrio sp.]